MKQCDSTCDLFPPGKHCVDCKHYHWEDEPDRIAHQEWLQNMSNKGLKLVTDPSPWEPFEVRFHKGKKYDELSARHNGLIGMGARLKQLIKKENQ
jgi:hypothetical protein